MILDAINKTIEVLLDGTVASNQLPCTSSFTDMTTTTNVTGEFDAVTNNVTPVVIVQAPAASTQRRVLNIDIYNADTVSRTVTVRYNNNSTTRILVSKKLSPGDTLQWVPDTAWTVIQGTQNVNFIDGINTLLAIKRYTAAVWTSTNPTLAQGEVGFETDNARFKIGDGTTAWNSLFYYRQKTRSVATTGAITMQDGIVSVTATSTQTLPATTGSGTIITVKNGQVSGNVPCNVTINCTGSDKIDGQASMILNSQFDWVTFQDVAAGNWSIVSWDTVQHTHMIYNMGDSLSAGGQMDSTMNGLLGNAWTYKDLGIGGSRTTDMVSRMTAVTGPGDAEYLLFWGGVNDCLALVASATIIANIQSICTTAHNAGIKVICCTIGPCGHYSGWSSSVQTIIDAVNTAIKTTITNIDYIIDLYQTLGAGNNYLTAPYDAGDGLHPSTAGYTACGTAIYNGTTWVYQKISLFQIGLTNNISLNQSLCTTDNAQFQSVEGSNGQLALNCVTGNPVAIGSSGNNVINSPATVANYQLNVMPKNTIGGLLVSASNGQTGAWITTDTGIVLVAYATTQSGTAIESYGTNHVDSPIQRAVMSGFSWNIANNKICEVMRELGLATGTELFIATGGELYVMPTI
jgi:lysophospholipase L1-like esterase